MTKRHAALGQEAECRVEVSQINTQGARNRQDFTEPLRHSFQISACLLFPAKQGHGDARGILRGEIVSFQDGQGERSEDLRISENQIRFAVSGVCQLHGWFGETACQRCSRFPAGVRIFGSVEIGEGVSICEPAELNGTGSHIALGRGCDLAAFVTLNVADSSRRCVGKSGSIERGEIVLGEQVFVGTGTVIIGPCRIGSRVRIGACCFLKGCVVEDEAVIPPGTVLLWGRLPDLLRSGVSEYTL